MTQATDLIDKLKTDVLKLVPATGAEHATINVIAGILDVASAELGPVLETKIDVSLLLTGLGNVESGITQTIQGGEQINAALKGPATPVEPATGNA